MMDKARQKNMRSLEDELDLKDRALQATSEGITITDARLPDNPVIYVNPGFERLTGYSADEILVGTRVFCSPENRIKRRNVN